MNWIFPIAGFGTRTSKLGSYKPLIEIIPNYSIIKMCLLGLKSMFTKEDDLFFIVSEQQEADHCVCKKINLIIKDLNLKNKVHVILLNKTPAGQALTLKEGIQKIPKKLLTKNTFVINSDQVVFFDLDDVNLNFPSVGLYFNKGTKSCFYDLDVQQEKIKRIREKEKISCYAAAGVFYFPSIIQLDLCIDWAIQKNKFHNKELFLGPCMGYFKQLNYFQTLIKFDLGNVKKIDLFKSFLKAVRE